MQLPCASEWITYFLRIKGNILTHWQEFVETDPILSEFKAEISRFEEYELQVDDIEQSIINGAIEMNTGMEINHPCLPSR